MKKIFGMFYEGPGPGEQDPMVFSAKPYNLFYRGSGRTGTAYDPDKAKSDVDFYYHKEDELPHIH